MGVAALPWPTDRLDGMVLHAGGDGALGAVLLCDVACDSVDAGASPVRLAPFEPTIDADGTVTVEEVGDRSDLVENLGNYVLVSASDAAIDVQLIDADGGGSITHITPDGSRTAHYRADLKLVCRSGDGWVGIERVDVTDADAVPWSQD